MNIGGRESVREGYLLRKILYEGGIAVDKDTSGTIRRAEHFQVVLIGEGIMVGGIAGFVVMMIVPGHILNYKSNHPAR